MSPKLIPLYPKTAYASLKTIMTKKHEMVSETRRPSGPLTWLMEHAAGVVAVLVSIVGRIPFHKRFLDFVIVDSGANRELKVLLSDRIPELVDHHDGQ